MSDNLDLIVLGGGSAGLASAFRAAEHGARVTLLHPRAIGGTCVHRGCVPKKIVWLAAQLAQAQRRALDYGFDSQPGPLDWAVFRRRRDEYIDGIEKRYRQRLHEQGITVVNQAGRLVSPDTVELADGGHLRAPHVLIATGARPRELSVPGFELGMVSDDMFALDAMPARIAIAGGGYVAVEFAGLLNALGAEVHLLVRDPVLGSFDAALVETLTTQMKSRGIRIIEKTEVKAVRRDDRRLMLEDGKGGSHGPCDALLWAVGRVPNVEDLGLEQLGVETDEHGHVSIDKWQDTNVEGVHAVGDVTACKALTPVASAAGIQLMDRLFGGKPEARLDYENIPSVVFSEPPMGMVGLTEAQARKQHGESVSVHDKEFTPMQDSLVRSSGQSRMKLVCVGEQQRVVGIHALGPGVDEMLQGFAVALRLGLRKCDLDTTIAIHPTSSEEMLSMD